MPTWSTACLDWEQRIVEGRSLIPPPLFPDEAAAALDVFGAMKVVDAAGKPSFADSRPFILDFVAAIFGAYDASTGVRLIREFFLLEAKKNAKSTTAAGVMVTALCRNWRDSGEFYILAPTKEVANNSFFPARDSIKEDDELREILHIREAERIITHRVTKAFLKVVAADAETVSGKKTIGALVDELWLFGKRANAASMLREALGGLVSRPEGFVIWLTTQSDEPPAGVYREKLDYFRGVRDGEIEDPAALPVLYEFPPAMVKAQAYLDPANFYITNPNLGVSVSKDWIARELAIAQRAGAHDLNVFLAKHLNVEIGQNLRADRWAGADVWAAATDFALTLDTLLQRSECVVVGIDGGGLDDLLGLSILGRERGTQRWLAWGHAFCNISVLRRRKSIAAELIDFAKAGELEVFDAAGRIDPGRLAALIETADAPVATPAPIDPETPAQIPPDIRALVALVKRPLDLGLLGMVGIDPHGIGLILEGLKTIEVFQKDADLPEPAAPLEGVSQGWKLTGAIKTTERKLEDRTLVHADQPLMAWSVGNARTKLSGNATMITKAVSGTAKIDPLIALYTSVAGMSTNPEPAKGGPSVYERRGFLVV